MRCTRNLVQVSMSIAIRKDYRYSLQNRIYLLSVKCHSTPHIMVRQ